MIVDSCVWIDYFNGIKSKETNRLDQLLAEGEIEILDIIITEVLQGFRSDTDFAIAKNLLSELTTFEVLGKTCALQSAENFRSLRKNGVTIRKTIDVIIATYCIENDKSLLASDRDFNLIAKHLPLKLAE
ncbi:MAG: PIN domain nuclease [Balneolaceae bacterium]|nr:PIN domain nuclease [Balneolaceae bacterium]